MDTVIWGKYKERHCCLSQESCLFPYNKIRDLRKIESSNFTLALKVLKADIYATLCAKLTQTGLRTFATKMIPRTVFFSNLPSSEEKIHFCHKGKKWRVTVLTFEVRRIEDYTILAYI